jgi:hypothetical protein
MIQQSSKHLQARMCDSFTVGLSKSEVQKTFGSPQCREDPQLFWAAPPPMGFGNTEEVLTYTFDKSSVHLAFKKDKCIGTTSQIEVEPFDRGILWLMVLKRAMIHGDIGNSEFALSREFGGAPIALGYPQRGNSSGWGG